MKNNKPPDWIRNFGASFKIAVNMGIAEVELMKLMPQGDVDRVKEWAKNRSMSGVNGYIGSLEMAYSLSLDGYAVDDILRL